MRIKPSFPYVRKSILGLTAIGIESGEGAASVVVRCFFRFFSSVKKERKSERPCVFVYLAVITRVSH